MKSLQLPVLGLALLAVAGCNETSQPQATQTAQLPCHCTEAAQPAQPAEPAPQQTASRQPSIRRLHHHYGRWAWSHAHEAASGGYDYSYEESESSRSVERVYRSEEAEAGAEVDTGYSVWIDGYGRKHCYYTGHHDHDRHDGGWQAVNDDRSRLDPWKGYDGNDGPENGY